MERQDEHTRNLVKDRIQRSIDVKQMLLENSEFLDATETAAMRVLGALRADGKVFFFGNGGSAADAQHLTAEFTGRYLKERQPLPALALSVNSSSITAIGNDYGYELVFARQLDALGRKGDVAFGISTSGNAANVVKALEIAKSKGIFAIGLTGADGGRVRGVADCTIRVPSKETPRIQECHILTGHIICEIVETLMFDDPQPALASDGFLSAKR